MLFNSKKKKMLLDWQNTLLAEPVPKLIMTEQQLKAQTQIRVENDLRIIADCNALIEKTVKPDVFFSRLQLLEEKAVDLTRFEKYIPFTGAKPSDALGELRSNKQEAIGQFLIRYFGTVFDKAESLKTDKAKMNQYQKFYDSVQPFFGIMNEKNIDYVKIKHMAYARLIIEGQK